MEIRNLMGLNFEAGSLEYNTLNWISVISSLAIIVYVIFLKFVRPVYLDRVSLKIQAVIALVDIIRHLNFILNGYDLGDTACAIQGFLYFFCFHAITFMNFAIALNLQIIYLHEIVPLEYFGKFLYTIPIIVALVIDLIPFTMNAYGRDIYDFCFLKLKDSRRETLKMILLYITNYPLLLYCFIISLLLMIKLLITRYMFKPSEDSELQPLLRPMQDPLSRTLGFRVSLYPLACSLCHSGEVVLTVLTSLTGPRQSLVIWSTIGLSINGTVNFICFLLDPYIQESWSPPELEVSNEPSERNNIQNDSHLSNQSSSNYRYYSGATSNLPVSDQSSSISGSTNTDSSSHVNVKADSRKSTKLKKQVRFDLDRTRYYIAPIPIPGARSPDEYKREIWHTTDLHLDVKKQYRLR